MSSESNSAGACGCQNGWPRRDFLKLVGLGTAATTLRPWEAMAGPFTRADFEKLVPRDKKLRPEWVRSLFERGQRTVYRGEDLASALGCPSAGCAQARCIWAATDGSGTGTFSTGTLGPGRSITPSRWPSVRPLRRGSRSGSLSGRGEPSAAAGPDRLARRVVYWRVSDRLRRLSGSRLAGGGGPRGVLALHSAEHGGFVTAGHGDAVHRAQHERRGDYGARGWPVAEPESASTARKPGTVSDATASSASATWFCSKHRPRTCRPGRLDPAGH